MPLLDTPSSSAPSDRDVRERERRARAIARLSRLLAERPELQGVHAPADLTADAVRWCA